MMAELNVRFNIRLTQSTFRWLLAALVMALSVTDVGSESVTLNTYYPAPSGVYNYMITTNNTYLARDLGNLGVGTGAPTSKVDIRGITQTADDLAAPDTSSYASFGVTRAVGTAGVNYSYLGMTKAGTVPWALGIAGNGGPAPTNSLVFGVASAGKTINTPLMSIASGGNVGIGSASQGAFPLDVRSSAGGGWLGYFGNTTGGGATLYVAHGGGYGAYLDAGTNAGAGTYALDVNRGGAPVLYVTGDGMTGLGTTPMSTLDVNYAIGLHPLDGVGTFRQTGQCAPKDYGLGVTACAAGQYASQVSGVMTQYQTLGNTAGNDEATGQPVTIYIGSMLCCTCPVGTCNVPGW